MKDLTIKLIENKGEPHFYVNSTDTFMSGWGMAQHKNNRCTVPAWHRYEGQIIQLYIESRTDQNRVTTSIRRPKTTKSTLVSDLVNWRATAARHNLENHKHTYGKHMVETAEQMIKESEELSK